jgi:hypothetical protein
LAIKYILELLELDKMTMMTLHMYTYDDDDDSDFGASPK